jgi:N-methylhydantoinase A
VLGRLNPEALLAVDHPVSLETVRERIMSEIGSPLGMASVDEAASAILRIANIKMAEALRLVSLARGHDPRDFALFAFGGAGPLHAVALARELGVPKVLVPSRPGITNAVGCVVADVRHDYVNTLNTPLPLVDMALVQETLERQIAEGQATIEREGVEIEELTVIHDVDMQFQGQTHILTVPLASTKVVREQLHEVFEKAYWNRFAVELPEIRPVLVNLHTAVIGHRKDVPLSALMKASERKATVAECRIGTRSVWFEQGRSNTPIYRREHLPLEGTLEGPAIIEQLDSTTVVEPGNTVAVDTFGNLLITV